jgi:hypothetical protein
MIFVSYSRRDEKRLDRFQDVFKPLSTYAELDLWSDRRIKPGDDWKSEINRAMNAAYAAVLLVSVNFLASDFIANEELPYLLDAAKKRDLRILWVLLTPYYIEVTPLRHIQAAGGESAPLNKMTEYEWMAEFCGVCKEID